MPAKKKVAKKKAAARKPASKPKAKAPAKVVAKKVEAPKKVETPKPAAPKKVAVRPTVVLGTLGNCDVHRMEDVIAGNRTYNKLYLSDGTTQVLNDRDLKAQFTEKK